MAAVSKALASQHLDNPEVVVTAIVHALTARHPKTRYLVGQGASMIRLLRLLPDRVRDGLLLRTFGLAHVHPGS